MKIILWFFIRNSYVSLIRNSVTRAIKYAMGKHINLRIVFHHHSPPPCSPPTRAAIILSYVCTCVSITQAQNRNWVTSCRSSRTFHKNVPLRENVLVLVFRTFTWNVPAVQWNGQRMPAGILYRSNLNVPTVSTFETPPKRCVSVIPFPLVWPHVSSNFPSEPVRWRDISGQPTLPNTAHFASLHDSPPRISCRHLDAFLASHSLFADTRMQTLHTNCARMLPSTVKFHASTEYVTSSFLLLSFEESIQDVYHLHILQPQQWCPHGPLFMRLIQFSFDSL